MPNHAAFRVAELEKTQTHSESVRTMTGGWNLLISFLGSQFVWILPRKLHKNVNLDHIKHPEACELIPHLYFHQVVPILNENKRFLIIKYIIWLIYYDTFYHVLTMSNSPISCLLYCEYISLVCNYIMYNHHFQHYINPWTVVLIESLHAVKTK